MTKIPDTQKNSTGVKPSGRGVISRRTMLAGAAMAGAGAAACMAVTRAAAQSKQKQADVQYQSSPKGADKCSGCAMFQPPDACQGVEGTISPDGWCSMYTPKA